MDGRDDRAADGEGARPPPGGPPPGAARLRIWLDRARSAALPVVIALATAFFLRFVNDHYAIGKWLFWRYAEYWLCAAFWALACTATGHVTLRALLRRPLPFAEHLVTAFATGVFEFFLGMFVGGLFRLYGAVFFFALPGLMLAACGFPFYRYLRRFSRHIRAARRRARPVPYWVFPVVLFGLLGFGMVYFALLTPENAQFDARWKHLALADEYVAYGGIRRSAEGGTVLTFPHLASFVYAWAFMLPRGLLFDHVELAAHLEFVCFAASVLGISALVRLLVPKTHGELAWAARFLFPGVFLYDSCVSLGADHVAALYVVPIYTLLVRAYRELSPRYLALLAAMLSGGVLVKYTSSMMLAPVPAAVVGFRAVVLAVQSLRGKITGPERRNWYLGPLAAIAAGLVLSTPHWLKNWIWYGDPLYPSLHQYLTLRPWTQDSADLFEYGYKEYQFWRPPHTMDGFVQTLKALFNFSFIPNDYARYHGKVPVFGSLFTLSFFFLPFVKGQKRLVGLFLCVYFSVFVWYWTHHQDRYLQTLVPWMAAATAGTMLLAWRTNKPARVALAALVGVSIVWGGDVYFIPSHAMVGSPVKKVVEMLSAGYRKDYEGRFKVFGVYPEIGQKLPADARVLLHDNHVHAGLGRTSVSDWGGWQFGISYGRQKSPREVYDLLQGLGVTHLVWDTQVSKGWDSVAGDLMFFDFAVRYGAEPKKLGSTTLAKMPSKPPEGDFNEAVAFLGCNDGYKSGLYRLHDLTVPVFGPKRRTFPAPERPGPPDGDTAEALVAAAGFAVLDPRCQKGLPDKARAGFVQAANRKVVNGLKGQKTLELWIRTSGTATPSALPAATPPSPPATLPEDEPADEEPGSDDEGP